MNMPKTYISLKYCYQFFCIGSSTNKNMNILISMILCQIKNFLFDITSTPISVDLYAKSKIFHPQIPNDTEYYCSTWLKKLSCCSLVTPIVDGQNFVVCLGKSSSKFSTKRNQQKGAG